MTYGYVRVSTDRQVTDNQRFEIEKFCKKQNIKIDNWIEETISGTKDPKKRKLGNLLDNVSSGDLIVCSEISRLGRKLFMIMSILQTLLDKNVKVWTIKDNYRLGDDIQSKILAFAFGIATEIERDMISQRTKEALSLKVAKGVILGHPRGKKNSFSKLTPKKDEIIKLLKQGKNDSEIAREIGTHRNTLAVFIVRHDLNEYRTNAHKNYTGLGKKFKILEYCKISNIKRHIREGMTIEEIAEKYNVSRSSVIKLFECRKDLHALYADYHAKKRIKHNGIREGGK